MLNSELLDQRAGVRIALFAFLLALVSISGAQTGSSVYARKNSFGVIVAYSNDSSHILLGSAAQRKLFDVGLSYGRRLFLNRIVNWQYDAEFFPVALDSDPLQVTNSTFTFVKPPMTLTNTTSEPTIFACHPSSGSQIFPNGDSVSWTSTCSRRWVVGQAFSPVGMRWNLLPRRRLQPLVEGHGGYMYSTQPIPLADAGSFNFTFDFGLGAEYFRTRSQSVRLEYRYHHISNHETAFDNPGIDNGVLQVSYVFGR